MGQQWVKVHCLMKTGPTAPRLVNLAHVVGIARRFEADANDLKRERIIERGCTLAFSDGSTLDIRESFKALTGMTNALIIGPGGE